MIYKYQTEGISPKDFGNYQNPIELFKDLRDGNINPKEVLKDQINFDQTRAKSKSKDQISVIQNLEIFFWLREKIIDFMRDYSLLLSEDKYKAKYGRSFTILTPKQRFKDFQELLYK